MVRHIVMFRLAGTPEERRRVATEFAHALDSLPAQIDVLKAIETGVNSNPGEEWDVVLTATLDSMDDIPVYSAHPAHKACVRIIAPVREARACVDYEI